MIGGKVPHQAINFLKTIGVGDDMILWLKANELLDYIPRGIESVFLNMAMAESDPMFDRKDWVNILRTCLGGAFVLLSPFRFDPNLSYKLQGSDVMSSFSYNTLAQNWEPYILALKSELNSGPRKIESTEALGTKVLGSKKEYPNKIVAYRGDLIPNLMPLINLSKNISFFYSDPQLVGFNSAAIEKLVSIPTGADCDLYESARSSLGYLNSLSLSGRTPIASEHSMTQSAAFAKKGSVPSLAKGQMDEGLIRSSRGIQLIDGLIAISETSKLSEHNTGNLISGKSLFSSISTMDPTTLRPIKYCSTERLSCGKLKNTVVIMGDSIDGKFVLKTIMDDAIVSKIYFDENMRMTTYEKIIKGTTSSILVRDKSGMIVRSIKYNEDKIVGDIKIKRDSAGKATYISDFSTNTIPRTTINEFMYGKNIVNWRSSSYIDTFICMVTHQIPQGGQ